MLIFKKRSSVKINTFELLPLTNMQSVYIQTNEKTTMEGDKQTLAIIESY